ncbi:MAG: hypothetical protein CGU29_13305 [Candidatus Dactylopiibacterium carminicum]|uniref:EAL domain-containing protein n=1 Tax=Candidatus Dactylopiibacterium carminicum TaxID=857335 RepID=A0A272EPW1_9RHOO|nr:hypothetical protein [Candidatus Dactylopiibacterium carminicum]PAS92056.1 MAG: hypothetical protein CGU29_13305 [Candidatus Dactylopiibacterium carminicum]
MPERSRVVMEGLIVALLLGVGLPALAAPACAPLPAELVEDTRLEAGCTYHQGVTITRPLTLDC